MGRTYVDFDKYCKICRYKHLSPTTLPCDDCNEIYYNNDSDKPKYFVPEEKE